jgi:hypothetical protein
LARANKKREKYKGKTLAKPLERENIKSLEIGKEEQK